MMPTSNPEGGAGQEAAKTAGLFHHTPPALTPGQASSPVLCPVLPNARPSAGSRLRPCFCGCLGNARGATASCTKMLPAWGVSQPRSHGILFDELFMVISMNIKGHFGVWNCSQGKMYILRQNTYNHVYKLRVYYSHPNKCATNNG
jgi:hypothetical protein